MHWLQRLPLRLKIASVAGVVLLLMLGALSLMVAAMNHVASADQQKDQAMAVADNANQLLVALRDMETGVRGYVITRDLEFLEPYHTGAATYPILLQRLESVLNTTPRQLERLSVLRHLIDRWNREVLIREIFLVDSGSDAVPLVVSKAGKNLSDQIRETIDEIKANKNREVEQYQAQTERAYRLALPGTALAILVAASLSLWLAVRVARTITQPIDELVAAAGLVAAGQAGYLVHVRAQDEVGALARHFNHMSEALLAHQEETAAQNEELQAQQEELIAQNEELRASQDQLHYTTSQLERDRERLERVNHLNRILVGSPSLRSLADSLLGEMLGTSEAQVGALALIRPDGQMQIVSQVGLTEEAAVAGRAVGFLRQSAATGKTITANYPHTGLLRPVYHTALPVEHEVYLPVRYSDEALAVAVVGRTGATPFSPEDIAWLTVMASQSAAALSNRLAYDQLNQAYVDLRDSAAHIEELTAEIQSERDQARAQRDNLRAVLDTTSEGIWLVDNAGGTILVNDRFWELTGTEPDSAVTLVPLMDLLARQLVNAEPCHRLVERIMVVPDLVDTDAMEFKQPAGRVLQRFTAPVYSEGGERIGRLFVLRDVSRETEIDRMKTEFISTVSHELRTPLTSIRGFVDLILDGDVGPVPDEQREFLQLVSRNTVRLSNLINDLLDVEKIENSRIEMRKELVDVAVTLEHVTRTFQVVAQEKGLDLNLQIDGPMPYIAGDADRITQIFTNLLSNAVKYTKQGSIAVHARQEGQEIAVSVTDTGIGIGPDHLPNLFAKFYRVDTQYTREVGGAGLGLAITRAIAERHGGRIEVSSTAGEGSTFTVRLPARPPVGTAPDQAAKPIVLQREGKLVLIVEDEADVARLIAQHLGRHGLQTVIAPTGQDGLQQAHDLKPDLITLDVMLPGMDGWEVISHLKRDPATREIPVVFLSILEETEKGIRMGADAYLTKPIDPQALGSTVDRLLNHATTTTLVAVSGSPGSDLLSKLAECGCSPVVAEPFRDLAVQVIEANAGMVLLDRDWSGRPAHEVILALRRAPGLEAIPVLVLGPTGVELDGVPDVIRPQAAGAQPNPETIASEIMRRLS